MSSCNTATTYTSTLNYRQDTGGTDIVYQGKGICAIHSQMPSQRTLTTDADSAAGTYVLYFPSTAGLYTGVWANAAGIPADTHVHTIQSTFVQLDTTLATTITTGTPIIFTPGPIGVPTIWGTAPANTYAIPAPNSDGTYGPQHATDPFTYTVQMAAADLGFGQSFKFAYNGIIIYGEVV